MTRRILNLSLFITAGVLILSACGGGSGDSAAQNHPPSAAEAAPGATAKPGAAATGEVSPATTSESASPLDSSAESAQKAPAEGSEPVVIGFGEPVKIMDYIPAGQTTIVDFYSKYCPPCMRISPYLDKLDEDRDDIKVVRVDINRPGTKGIDWGSPVARQFKLHSIPHFQVYDPNQQLIAEGDKAYKMVVGFIQGKS